MAKMVNCKACNKEIAKGVNKCVHCGKDQRNFFMKHKVLSVILALVIIGGISSAMNGDKDVTTTTATGTKTTTTEKPVEKKVVVLKVTTAVLAKAYDDNEVKADTIYKDKMIETSGKITDISVVLGNTTLNLATGADFDLGILCSFKEKVDIDKIANLKKGDTVTVQGMCDGKGFGVTVNDCKLK